jgi:hypothetical protein
MPASVPYLDRICHLLSMLAFLTLGTVPLHGSNAPCSCCLKVQCDVVPLEPSQRRLSKLLHVV